MYGRFFISSVSVAYVAVATAAFASANSVDDAFIATIDGYPVPYSTTENAITTARAVCDHLASGKTVDAVVLEIGGPANWTIPQSRFFVDAAVVSYCSAGIAPTATGAQAPLPFAQAPAAQAPAPVYAPAPSSSYFSNCSAARSAGAAPLYVGRPGYRSALDRDGDGVACE